MSLDEQVARWRGKIDREVTPERVEGWVTRAFDRADDQARKHLGSATGDLVAAALDELRPSAPAIARRGVSAFRGALTAVWSGDPEAAKRAWLELDAMTPEERRARLRDAIVRADDAVAQAERDWEELQERLQKAGKVALELAIPILLALL